MFLKPGLLEPKKLTAQHIHTCLYERMEADSFLVIRFQPVFGISELSTDTAGTRYSEPPNYDRIRDFTTVIGNRVRKPAIASSS